MEYQSISPVHRGGLPVNKIFLMMEDPTAPRKLQIAEHLTFVLAWHRQAPTLHSSAHSSRSAVLSEDQGAISLHLHTGSGDGELDGWHA